jgi:hypothetical protein
MTLPVPNVTAPFRAKALPSILTVLFSVMLVSATILPLNVVPVLSVAALPTCHHTFLARAPPLSAITAFGAVVSVDPIWNTHTPLAGPASVTVPVTAIDDATQ